MSKRNTQQRRQLIVSMLMEQNELSVDYLAQFFDTSEVTIRKDLRVLEEGGFLLRRYGGAINIPSELMEEENNEEQLSKQKLAIAKAACEIISDHNRIIIDSGSTTGALVKALNQKGLVIMTNSLSLASELTTLECEPTVLMTGGTWEDRKSVV